MERTGLELAKEKTQTTIVRGRRVWQQGQMEIMESTVPLYDELKYLGVWIDCKLNFRKHIEAATDKANRVINALCKLMPNVGGPGAMKRKVMSTAALSVLLYGAEIWAPALETKSYRNKMEGAQRKLLLRVASAYRTVAADVVQVLAGVPPIDLLAEERRDRYLYEERK